MKTLKQLLLLLTLITTITLTSCSTDEAGGDGTAPSGILTATVDGKSYKSLEISSSATVANAGGIKNLVIIASNSDGNAFAITIFGYEGEGTYELTGANLGVTNIASYTSTDVNLANPTASTTQIWSAPYNDTKVGIVTVTEESDTKVIGTFSFKAKDSTGGSVIDVTNGAFNLKKQTT
jgi:hypothetical protein